MTDVKCWICKVGYYYIMVNGTMGNDGLPLCVCSHCESKATSTAIARHSYKQLRSKAEKPVNTAYQYSLDFKE